MAKKSFVRAAVLGFTFPLVVAAVACSGDVTKPFQRWSPEVDKAIVEIDAGKADAAQSRLGTYLAASSCDGGMGFVPGAADAAPATFDLGLSLFAIAESFGKPFGTYVAPSVADAGPGANAAGNAERKAHVDCARSILDQALSGPAGSLAPDLEARARYLRGNLAYLDGRWDDAVGDYDRALAVVPGLSGDAGDGVGRDAAWNRALALRNKEEEEKQDAGSDAGKDGGDDAGDDAGKDGGDDAGKDGGDDAGKDGGDDAGKDGGDDAGKDGGGKDGGEDGGKDAGQDAGAGGASGKPQPPPAATANQDEKMLDAFEGAPTFQKAQMGQAGRRARPGMQDK